MSEFALNALARKRTELLRESEDLQARLDQIRADVLHLDAAIRIMDPNPDLTDRARWRENHKGTGWFAHGELGRLILEVLRDAEQPLTAAAVAKAVMERRSMDQGDGAMLRRLIGMVGPALRRQGNHGRTVEQATAHHGLAWRLSEP